MRLKNNFSDINLLVNNLHTYAKDENYVKTFLGSDIVNRKKRYFIIDMMYNAFYLHLEQK